MIEQVLFYIHYGLLLIFGVVLGAVFSGLSLTRRNLIWLGLLAAFCGGLQVGVLMLLGEKRVWQLYPLITHLPLLLVLRFGFGRPLSGAVAATASAYLCCQIAKWFGLVTLALTGSVRAELAVRIVLLIVTLAVILRWFAGKITLLYSRRNKSSLIFGLTPVIYYLFDYAVGIYSSLWAEQHRLVVEFMPFFLCLGYLLFCTVYHREFELKNEAEQKEQLLRILLEQQKKEVETIRRSEAEIRRLRHDFRLLLNSLSSSIERSDLETAQKLISGFSDRVEASSMKRYCGSDTLNYILSDYAARCREQEILFQPVVELGEISVDEILFSSILANALDNALNAQEGLPRDRRQIRLMLKNSNGKILLSIKNTFREYPAFREGFPVTDREGHGCGVSSIRYATEKLGGNCRFFLEEDWFILQLVV